MTAGNGFGLCFAAGDVSAALPMHQNSEEIMAPGPGDF